SQKLYSQSSEDEKNNTSESKPRTQEILRITPLLGSLFPLTHIAMKVKIENIAPNSIAKNIVVKCKFPDTSIFMKNKGVFEHKSPLIYKDSPVTFTLCEVEHRDKLFSQKFIYEATYLDGHGNKIKQNDQVALAELITDLEETVKNEKFPNIVLKTEILSYPINFLLHK
ncbi:unnamed protein product, partial [marine sediment metagenome]